MPALYLILNSAYYSNNYAGIFDVGLYLTDTITNMHITTT